MASTWVKVSSELAKKHPLYGRGGWLVVLAIVVAFSFLKQVSELRAAAFQAGMSEFELLGIDHPFVTLLKSVLVIYFVFASTVLWSLLARHAKFRLIATTAFASLWPCVFLVSFALPETPGVAESLVAGTIPWVISCIIWITYLHRSKRVRVTFDSCIRSDDPILKSTSINEDDCRTTQKPIDPDLPDTGTR